MQCRPFFATPCLSSNVAYEFAGSMASTGSLLARRGIDFYQVFLPGVPFIDAARNSLLSQFLTDFPDATDLFFLDDDVGFPVEKVIEFLERPEEIVCGVYPLKGDSANAFPVMFKLKDGKTIHNNGVVQALNIPAGFLRLKRSVVERIASKAETYTLEQKDDKPRVCFNVFEMGPVRGEYVGEDVIFSRKCHDLGIDLWVDPNIDFHHRGTRKWQGNLSKTLNAWLSQNQGTSS